MSPTSASHLCVLHLALTSRERVGRRRDVVRFRLPHTRGWPLGYRRTVTCLINYPKTQCYKIILEPRHHLSLSKMEHRERKTAPLAELPWNLFGVQHVLSSLFLENGVQVSSVSELLSPGVVTVKGNISDSSITAARLASAAQSTQK